jgi:hypothetical protein
MAVGVTTAYGESNGALLLGVTVACGGKEALIIVLVGPVGRDTVYGGSVGETADVGACKGPSGVRSIVVETAGVGLMGVKAA